MDAVLPDDLYDERGQVTWCRPILQGDVFGNVVLPGFGDEPRFVQVVTHPCAMRRGSVLNERTTVAPVDSYQKVTGTDWNGHLKVMPLPDLIEDGQRHYAAKFTDITAAPSELLALEYRVATLSHRGIYVLQQRLVKHNTRLDLPLDILRNQSAPVFAEAEMQEEWVESTLDGAVPTQAIIEEAAKNFDSWLSEGKPSRRDKLGQEANHAGLRREARRAVNRE
jgi:hypothetical protein